LYSFVLAYSETEKPTSVFTVIVFKISRKTYSHRCQCAETTSGSQRHCVT